MTAHTPTTSHNDSAPSRLPSRAPLGAAPAALASSGAGHRRRSGSPDRDTPPQLRLGPVRGWRARGPGGPGLQRP